LRSKQFDLVFSHHVLEHVSDIGKAVAEIVRYLKPGGIAINILPCGHKGSLEYSICTLRSDGINSAFGNRFFYEDRGHVRRLTSAELVGLFRGLGLSLLAEFYSGQRYGAVEWITQSIDPRIIFALCDPRKAVNPEGERQLRSLRRRLLVVWVLRTPACQAHAFFERARRRWYHYLLFTACLPFWLLSEPVERQLRKKCDVEWQERRSDRSGSEMYLVFQRS